MRTHRRMAAIAVSTLAATTGMTLAAHADADPNDYVCKDVVAPKEPGEQICLFLEHDDQYTKPGQIFTVLAGSRTLPGKFTVHWGDGSPDSTGAPEGDNVNGFEQHTYAVSGTYAVSVDATDSQGQPTVEPLALTVKVTVPGSPTPPTPTPPAPPAQPAPAVPAVHRIGGSDRYETARLVSQAQWKPGAASAVVLARGDEAPDALSGVPLAAHVHGPLLLTDPAGLDTATRAEIDRVTGGPGPSKTVYILGGEKAVSLSVEASLRKAGYAVVRYQGADRYRTALAVAESFGPTSHVIVATGRTFADALAAGPLGAVENAPIVLSDDRDLLDPATAAFVGAHHAIDPIGGAAAHAVAPLTLADPARHTVDGTLHGATRYETAALVAAKVIAVSGHPVTGVGIASGQAFPDALTGGAFAANGGIPVLLTEPTALSDAARGLLVQHLSALTAVTVFGGEKAVAGTVETAVATAVKGKVQ